MIARETQGKYDSLYSIKDRLKKVYSRIAVSSLELFYINFVSSKLVAFVLILIGYKVSYYCEI